MGNRRVAQVHSETHEVQTYIDLPEPVYEYHRFKNKDVFKLYSGIHVFSTI